MITLRSWGTGVNLYNGAQLSWSNRLANLEISSSSYNAGTFRPRWSSRRRLVKELCFDARSAIKLYATFSSGFKFSRSSISTPMSTSSCRTVWSSSCFSRIWSLSGTAKYSGRSFWNQLCLLICAKVILLVGSTTSICTMRSFASLDKYPASVKLPCLIFLNKFGTFSSSKGNEPQSRAYRTTPEDHTSTSGPTYALPDTTSGEA
mmetsp:Transcript_88411/g.270609  ORF Transcript_88411/g.270609 Transcript_88411/m.270609 type:complete len:205 (+) Transcript_88411:407-1021(+)